MRLPASQRLTIPAENGYPANEYRIREGSIEFRSVQITPSAGHELVHDDIRGWRELSADEVQLHFALDTIVAKWLIERLGAVPYPANAA